MSEAEPVSVGLTRPTTSNVELLMVMCWPTLIDFVLAYEVLTRTWSAGLEPNHVPLTSCAAVMRPSWVSSGRRQRPCNYSSACWSWVG